MPDFTTLELLATTDSSLSAELGLESMTYQADAITNIMTDYDSESHSYEWRSATNDRLDTLQGRTNSAIAIAKTVEPSQITGLTLTDKKKAFYPVGAPLIMVSGGNIVNEVCGDAKIRFISSDGIKYCVPRAVFWNRVDNKPDLFANDDQEGPGPYGGGWNAAPFRGYFRKAGTKKWFSKWKAKKIDKWKSWIEPDVPANGAWVYHRGDDPEWVWTPTSRSSADRRIGAQYRQEEAPGTDTPSGPWSQYRIGPSEFQSLEGSWEVAYETSELTGLLSNFGIPENPALTHSQTVVIALNNKFMEMANQLVNMQIEGVYSYKRIKQSILKSEQITPAGLGAQKTTMLLEETSTATGAAGTTTTGGGGRGSY